MEYFHDLRDFYSLIKYILENINIKMRNLKLQRELFGDFFEILVDYKIVETIFKIISKNFAVN